MKKEFILKGWTVLFLFAILITGCNKDEELPDDFSELSLDTQEVMDKLPVGLTTSSDEKAQECVDMIEDALDMSAFQANLIVPDNAVRASLKASSDTWKWTFSHMGETWTFYWTYSEDSSREYWTMEIQYADGPRYDYITAWEYKDGSGGEVVYSFNWAYIYDQEYTDYVDLHWTYTWSIDASGNYHFEWTWDSAETEFDYYIRYSIVINDDGSGSLDYYLNDILFYHMEWDAAGNGSWHYYLGEYEESGSWTAG
ncbi:MAG: hypothetical protein U9R49_01000 [Bacteroidota bacterium]|nr:hypothetical protein [Bacteroidota bacterium]